MSLVLQSDGPGTTIIVRDGAQGLPSAPRGAVAILGTFQSGPTLAALALNSSDARRIAGDAHDDFEGSLSMGDVYHHFSPPVLIGRITDGNEVQSRLHLWDRKPSRGFLHREDQGDRSPLAIVKAHNGGRWAGQSRVWVTGDDLDLTSDLVSPVTLNTGETMLEDVWKGAYVYFNGDADGPYKVLSNSTSGVITLESEVGQDVIDASIGISNGVDGHVRIILENELELSVVVGEDSSRGQRFSIHAVRKFGKDSDWERVASYNDLQLSDDDDRPWTTTIYDGEETKGNYQIALETDYVGATVEEKLPANFCEIPVDVDGSTIEFRWWRWTLGSANTGNPYVDEIEPNDSTNVVPHVIELTFVTATTATPKVIFADGTEIQFPSADLTLGTPYDFAGHPQLCEITCEAGGTAAVASDTLSIRVNTLPRDLNQRESFVYPVAISSDGNSGIRLRVSSNTYKTVKVRDGLDLSTYGSVAAQSPTLVGTADVTSVTWTTGETLILTPDGGSAVTFTGDNESGWANIKAALESADTDGIFNFDQNADGRIVVTLAKSAGSQSRISVGNGTANTDFGVVNGTVVTGVDGVPFRIEGRLPMSGGYDGAEPSATQYALGVDLDNHIFKRFMLQNLGMVRLITPGVSTQSVIDACETFVRKHGWKYVAEFGITIEQSNDPVADAVNELITNRRESDYVDHIFPSRGKFRSVNGRKIVTRSLAGMFCGLKAIMANRGIDGERGLHIATANNNDQGRISPRVVGLPDTVGRWTPSSIKYANDHGVVLVLWNGNDLYFWGNRMYSKGRTPEGNRYTITERDVYYHIARDLFVTTRPFVFKSISTARLSAVVKSLRDKMKVYHADGWFSDHDGSGFDDQVHISTPPELNTPASLLEGNVTASIEFRPRPSLENLVIIITPTEVSEG